MIYLTLYLYLYLSIYFVQQFPFLEHCGRLHPIYSVGITGKKKQNVVAKNVKDSKLK